jgi:hypothetical protein
MLLRRELPLLHAEEGYRVQGHRLVSEHGERKGVVVYLLARLPLCSHTNTCRKVEGEAQGDDASMTKFLKDIDNGPPHATVVQLDKEARDVVEGETEFEVRR